MLSSLLHDLSIRVLFNTKCALQLSFMKLLSLDLFSKSSLYLCIDNITLKGSISLYIQKLFSEFPCSPFFVFA